MIKKIEVVSDFDRGIKPFVMTPQTGVNLLVGENGSGKSSLIYAITNKIPEVKIQTDSESSFFSFDTERDNPRTKTPNPNSSYEIQASVMSHFESHGETLFPILKHLSTFENTLIFLDEPESGISLGNQLKLYRAINKAVKNGCQLFIATHSYILIKKYKTVFDMEICKVIKSSEYLSKFKI